MATLQSHLDEGGLSPSASADIAGAFVPERRPIGDLKRSESLAQSPRLFSFPAQGSLRLQWARVAKSLSLLS